MGIGDAQRTQIHHPWSTSHDIIYEDTFPNLPNHARKKTHTKVVYAYYMENPGTCQLSKGRFPCWKSSSSGFQLFQWYSPPPCSKNPKIARSIAGAILVPQGLLFFFGPAEAQKHCSEEISEGYIWDSSCVSVKGLLKKGMFFLFQFAMFKSGPLHPWNPNNPKNKESRCRFGLVGGSTTPSLLRPIASNVIQDRGKRGCPCLMCFKFMT